MTHLVINLISSVRLVAQLLRHLQHTTHEFREPLRPTSCATKKINTAGTPTPLYLFPLAPVWAPSAPSPQQLAHAALTYPAAEVQLRRGQPLQQRRRRAMLL